MLAHLPERPTAGLTANGYRDSLGQQQTVRNEVAVPGIDDHLDRLAQQIAFNELNLHVLGFSAQTFGASKTEPGALAWNITGECASNSG